MIEWLVLLIIVIVLIFIILKIAKKLIKLLFVIVLVAVLVVSGIMFYEPDIVENLEDQFNQPIECVQSLCDCGCHVKGFEPEASGIICS